MNYVVMRGWKKQGDPQNSWVYYKQKEDVRPLVIDDDVDMLVGHNIKFDLLYEMCIPGGYENLMRFYKRGGNIWDTQYVEYLLRAQQQKYQMVAMDAIVESYGGRKKIDGLKALWAEGVQTSDIRQDILEDYLVGTVGEGRNSGDIGNTELIYKGQLEEVTELGMLATVQVRMDGLLATTEMEYRGLKINIDVAKKNMQDLMAEQSVVKARLAEFVTFIPEEVKFSWTSGTHMSCLLFGGTIRYEKRDTYVDPETGELARLKATVRWPLFRGTPVDPANPKLRFDEEKQIYRVASNDYPQDTYQSGKKIGEGKFKSVAAPGELKVKYQDFFYELPGITTPDPEWKTALTDGNGGPVYSTDKYTVVELGARDIPFLKDFARNAVLDKELGTYYARYDEKKKEYVGMLTCVDKDTGIVHHSLKHVSTVTTRLASADPNLQNLPRANKSRVKEMFVSRFGPDGLMVEEDYSQLEVVVQGLLSGDKNLQRDLIAQVDFHCKRVSAQYGCTYEEALDWCKNEQNGEVYKLWKPRRTGCKEFSFQRAYGAGAAAISAKTKMSVEDVKDLIENEDKMYPGVAKFNEGVAAEVDRTAEPFNDPERGWRTFRRGFYTTITGTRYCFRSYDAPAFLRKKGITDTFMPTEMKNYPIQGTGGEIVQMALGVLWRRFVATDNYGDKAYLVNTVHDCVWADTHKSVTVQVVKEMQAILSAVPKMLKKFFGIDCPVPFPVEAEVGPDMYNLKHFHEETA